MLSAEAHVRTGRPSRYLVQLCRHFSGKGRHLGHRPRAHLGGDVQAPDAMRAVAEQARVEWSETEGTVRLPWGDIVLRTAPGGLALRVDAESEENLLQLQNLLSGHLERFGRREGLQVSWQQAAAVADPAGSDTASAADLAAASGRTTAGRRHLKLGLAAVVVLVLAAHLGLGSVVAANWRWTAGAVTAVFALILVKAAVLGGFAVHRGWITKHR
jgi:hypothetical protein